MDSIIKKIRTLYKKALWVKLKGRWQLGVVAGVEKICKQYGQDEQLYDAKKSLKIVKKNVQRSWKVDFQSETYKCSVCI